MLGIGLGVFLGWAAGELSARRCPTYELVLPWGRMALFLVLARRGGRPGRAVAGPPGRQLNMLTAIKTE